jgi:rhodanese-related sulfurtransferase
VARYFLKNGYEKVFVLQGGWIAWQRAGYPVENK